MSPLSYVALPWVDEALFKNSLLVSVFVFFLSDFQANLFMD